MEHSLEQPAEDQERGRSGAEAEGGLQAGLPADGQRAQRPEEAGGRRSGPGYSYNYYCHIFPRRIDLKTGLTLIYPLF